MVVRRKRPEVPKMRGVEDLLSMSTETTTTVPLDKIHLTSKQPRRYFDPQKLAQLVQSVKEHGILEPLLVRTIKGGKYELVAGERRLRAAQEVGLAEVPVVIKSLTDTEALQVSLMENLQREDLNPLEETEALLELLAISLNISTDEVVSVLNAAANAKKRKQELTDNIIRQLEQIESILLTVGKFNAESFRVNRLPLLNLPAEILEVLRQGRIEYTKAKEIAKLESSADRIALLNEAITQSLSLSQIRDWVKAHKAPQEDSSLQKRWENTYKRIKKSSVWSNQEKREQLESLLVAMEALMASASED